MENGMPRKNLAAPITAEHAAALNYAREQIQWHRKNEINLLGVPVVSLDKGSNEKFALEMFKRWAMFRRTNMEILMKLAQGGDGLADQALRELIMEHVDRQMPLPDLLAIYNIHLLAKTNVRKTRGPKKESNAIRDRALFGLIVEIAERFGLQPTRNMGSQKSDSACSIVAAAFGLSEGAVLTIWNTWKDAR
jgi:hypothetical protein